MLVRKTRMDKLVDQIDGKTVYHSKVTLKSVSFWVANSMYPDDKREAYVFSSHPFTEAYRDRRTPILEITHSTDYTGATMPRSCHKLEVVMEPKNHQKNKPFHINLSRNSLNEIEKCPTCKKYFYRLNHFPFSYLEYGDKKFSDLNRTIMMVFEDLRNRGFFKEFPYGNPPRNLSERQ